MSCSCNRDVEAGRIFILPTEQCVLCAHKHISHANQLYNLELDYKAKNKSYAIGELQAAAWHLQNDHLELARQCRLCWLKIERFEDCHVELNELQMKLWEMVTTDNIK